ncbi:hypothetical protein HK102_008289, partial [Quaeritorhiza haematococci]
MKPLEQLLDCLTPSGCPKLGFLGLRELEIPTISLNRFTMRCRALRCVWIDTTTLDLVVPALFDPFCTFEELHIGGFHNPESATAFRYFDGTNRSLKRLRIARCSRGAGAYDAWDFGRFASLETLSLLDNVIITDLRMILQPLRYTLLNLDLRDIGSSSADSNPNAPLPPPFTTNLKTLSFGKDGISLSPLLDLTPYLEEYICKSPTSMLKDFGRVLALPALKHISLMGNVAYATLFKIAIKKPDAILPPLETLHLSETSIPLECFHQACQKLPSLKGLWVYDENVRTDRGLGQKIGFRRVSEGVLKMSGENLRRFREMVPTDWWRNKMLGSPGSRRGPRELMRLYWDPRKGTLERDA